MPIIAKEETKRDPVPEGAHHAVCYAIVALGTQPPLPGSQYTKRQNKVLCMFELPDERITVEREGVPREVPRVISKDFPLSLHEKANLRKFLTAWRGKAFTEVELKGFDLKNVLGANCILNVVHNAKGYADIASVTPLMKGLAKKRSEADALYFALDDFLASDDHDLPDALPKWVQERIERSDEWQEMLGGNGDSNGNGHGSYAPPPPEDDDIPF